MRPLFARGAPEFASDGCHEARVRRQFRRWNKGSPLRGEDMYSGKAMAHAASGLSPEKTRVAAPTQPRARHVDALLRRSHGVVQCGPHRPRRFDGVGDRRIRWHARVVPPYLDGRSTPIRVAGIRLPVTGRWTQSVPRWRLRRVFRKTVRVDLLGHQRPCRRCLTIRRIRRRGDWGNPWHTFGIARAPVLRPRPRTRPERRYPAWQAEGAGSPAHGTHTLDTLRTFPESPRKTGDVIWGQQPTPAAEMALRARRV